jgi:hypothetical protein
VSSEYGFVVVKRVDPIDGAAMLYHFSDFDPLELGRLFAG